MPITGHFEADFSSFDAGVKEATATLQKFDAESKDVGKSLDKMGAETPATIKAITGETKAATSSMFDLGGAVKQIGGMVAGMFTVQAILAFTASVFDAADEIGTLAAKTGMTTDEVQKLQFIAQQTSVSVSALTGAAQQLDADLGDNNAGVIGALAKVNINLDEFKKEDSYTRFVQLATAVGQIEDPFLRGATAQDAFHKSWKEIYPAMKADMEDLGKQAPILAQKYIDNLQLMKNAWDKLKTQVVNAGGAMIGGIVEANKQYKDGRKKAADWMAIQQSADDGLKIAMGAIPAAQKPVVAGFEAIKLSAEDTKIQAESWSAAAEASMKINKEKADATEAAYDELAAAFRKQNAEIDALFGRLSGADMVGTANTWAAALKKMGDNVGALSAKMRDELETTMRDAIETMARNGTLTSDQSSRYAELLVKLQLYDEELRKVPPTVEAASGVTTTYTQKLYDEARANDAVAAATANANAQRAAMDAATGGGGGSGKIGYLPPRGSDAYVAMSGGTTSGSGAGSSYYTPPRRASGGPVSAGSAYMVGKAGPELFVPGASGAIVPNGAVVNNVFHIVDTESNIARRVSNTILRTITSARRV